MTIQTFMQFSATLPHSVTDAPRTAFTNVLKHQDAGLSGASLGGQYGGANRKVLRPEPLAS